MLYIFLRTCRLRMKIDSVLLSSATRTILLSCQSNQSIALIVLLPLINAERRNGHRAVAKTVTSTMSRSQPLLTGSALRNERRTNNLACISIIMPYYEMLSGVTQFSNSAALTAPQTIISLLSCSRRSCSREVMLQGLYLIT